MAGNVDSVLQPKIMVLSDENLVSVLQKHLVGMEPAYFRPMNVNDAVEKAPTMHMVIVTLHLTEGGGIEALTRLRAADEDLPVIMIANNPQLVDVQVALRKGVSDFVPMPLEPEMLLESVRTAYEKRENLRRRFGLLGQQQAEIKELRENIRVKNQGVADFALGILRLRSATVEAHCRLSARVMEGFGRYLKWDPELVEKVRLAALIHDFGYYTMDERIRESGPTTNQELFIWKRHPIITKQFLKPVFPDLMWNIVELHHENFDGTGFPNQLVGSRTPPEVRAFCLVNGYAGKVMPGTLKKGMDQGEALLEIQNGAGTLYDPELVNTFINFLSEFKG